MARRGRKRQLELETEYWRLLASGVGTVEACKALGIGRKTGYRWRAETGGLPPVRRGEAGRAGRYLSLLERQRIATLRRLGLGVRRIAAELGRNPSTISRELLRRRRGHDRNYDGDLAHARAREAARRPRRNRLSRDEQLRQVVQAKPELEWSPEQIAAHLRSEYPDRPDWHLCPRDDLSGALPRRKGRVEQDFDPPAADRAPAAETTAPSQRPTGPVHRPGEADRLPPGRGG